MFPLLSLISLAKSAAEFAPAITNLFDGDDDEGTATEIVELIGSVTGVTDTTEAIANLRSNPSLQIQFQQAMNPIIIARLENRTKQLATINKTIQAEINSGDKFKSYWRPLLGYAVTITWAVQMNALSYLIFKDPGNAVKVITAMAGLSVMWGVALSILGVNISKRSQDKAMVAGHTPALGILGAITQRLGGGRG